jgi:hypothetical protein
MRPEDQLTTCSWSIHLICQTWPFGSAKLPA